MADSTTHILLGCRRGARLLEMAIGLAVVVASTGCTGAESNAPVVSTTTPASPSGTPSPTLEPQDAAAIPDELIGTWRSIGQGTAEVVYHLHADGSYESAEVLMQERPSGVFSFTIGAAGVAKADGDTLVLTQQRGRETMTDPDSPSSDFDRPLSPLEERSYAWSFDGGMLTLANEFGPVPFERIGDG